MKYIRTDLRIFDTDNPPSDLTLFEREIKQADTIEELCDCYVYHFLKSGIYSIMPKEDFEPQRKDCLLFHIKEKNHDVYGAIWTDKGLIYVAKMNDKGELELL